jgi:ADP-ribosylation factor-like protein 2
MTEAQIRDELDLASIRSHRWRIWSCSAMSGENLLEGLDWVVTDVAKRLYYSSTVVPSLPPQQPTLVS